MMTLSKKISSKQLAVAELCFILLFSFLPIFLDFPYRVNIYLVWEGAYRMSIGQLPFRDFGMPIGYGFWIMPWLFFKAFGPYLFTLVIAQCFINLTSLLVFRNILKLFGLRSIQIFLSVVVLCLSFVMLNFWPWYNHTAFVFEIIGFYFLLKYLLENRKIVFILLGSFFIALCFLTKQDAGGLGLMISGVLLLANALREKDFKPILWFALFYVSSLAILILPFLPYEFKYWFNYGQPPHFSRINMYDFVSTFFQESLWLKFYIVAVIIITILKFKSLKVLLDDKLAFYFTLFTLCILGQAMIIQVTSFSPPTTNFYFHSFAIAFLLYHIEAFQLEKLWVAIVCLLLIFFWQSENYWKYSMKFASKLLPKSFSPPPPNVVSKNTWSSKIDSVHVEPVVWSNTPYRTMRKIKLPVKTIEGIERIKTLDVVKQAKNLKCLNMSNLTPLAYELNYIPTAAPNFPLWYHKGVAFFDRESDMLCTKVNKEEYDLILFEVMPDVDNFFCFEVRECVRKKYKLVDTFPAPTGYQTDYVEVYVKN